MTTIYKYFLKTEDEAEGVSVLQQTLSTTQSTAYYTIVIIGEYMELTGGTEESPEYTAHDGWYFNVYSTSEIEWPESVVCLHDETAPVTPWSDIG